MRVDRAFQVSFSSPAGLAVENHEEQTRHVKSGNSSADQGNGTQDPRAHTFTHKSGLNDLVLGEEAGERRQTKDGDPADTHGDPGDLHGGAQVTKATHVDLVAHGVHDATGTQEQLGLEEAVGEQVEDSEGVADGA